MPPLRPVAATVTTPLQLAGANWLASKLLLPAAAITTVFLLRAAFMAFCNVVLQAFAPPKLILITRAGVGLAGTPVTLLPLAHKIPSAISEV